MREVGVAEQDFLQCRQMHPLGKGNYRRYKIRNALGIIFLANGNHKIAVRLHKKGFNATAARTEMIRYCKNYERHQKIKSQLYLYL